LRQTNAEAVVTRDVSQHDHVTSAGHVARFVMSPAFGYPAMRPLLGTSLAPLLGADSTVHLWLMVILQQLVCPESSRLHPSKISGLQAVNVVRSCWLLRGA
jgi:hypothetical protein